MLIKMIKSYITTFILLFTFVISYSQTSIRGKIIDEKDKALEFATIRIAGTSIGATSGLNGEYSLTVPPRDTINVIFTCIGYKEVKRQLINPDSNVTLNIKMMPQTYEMGEVEVTDFRKQSGQMQSIDASNVRLSPDASGGSVEAMLATMAGVNSSNEMSSQYSVRGGTYDENSVYINGTEVYRPQLVSSGQQEGLSIINPDLVGAISFSTGGYPAEYTDKMSSVLDIKYREPEAFEGALSASLMGFNASLGTNSKHFSTLQGFRYKRNSSLLSSMDTKGEYNPNFLDYQANFVYKINRKLKISFLGNIAVNNYNFTPTSRQTNFGTSEDAKQFKVYFDGQEKDRFETYFGALNFDYRASESSFFTLSTSGYLTNELVSYDISGEYWLDQAGTTGSGNPDNAIGGELGVGRYHEHARNRLKMSVIGLGLKGHTSLKNHNFTYGFDFKSQKIYERAREWELRDSAGFTLPTNPDAIEMIYSLTSRQDVTSGRFALYLQDAYKLRTNKGLWVLNGGLRYSYWSFNKESLISPRVSVAYLPDRNPNLTFRFATGLYYQQPFYKEYRQPIADEFGNETIVLNKDIKSEQSLHFIFGSDYTFRAMNRPFKFSAELYYKKLNNLIPYEIDNLKIVYSGINQTNGYTYGLDMKLFGQFVPGTDSWVSFSLMKTSENLNGVNVPRPTDQRYSFALFFTDYFPKIPKLKFSLRGIFSDGLPTTAPHTTRDEGYFRAPAYKRIDVGFQYALLSPLEPNETRSGMHKWFKSAWLGLDVFNLLDISNVSSYYWVTDVNNIQYAVPNYLTRRQINVRLTLDF